MDASARAKKLLYQYNIVDRAGAGWSQQGAQRGCLDLRGSSDFCAFAGIALVYLSCRATGVAERKKQDGETEVLLGEPDRFGGNAAGLQRDAPKSTFPLKNDDDGAVKPAATESLESVEVVVAPTSTRTPDPAKPTPTNLPVATMAPVPTELPAAMLAEADAEEALLINIYEAGEPGGGQHSGDHRGDTAANARVARGHSNPRAAQSAAATTPTRRWERVPVL